jgi:hypothetical protein
VLRVVEKLQADEVAQSQIVAVDLLDGISFDQYRK